MQNNEQEDRIMDITQSEEQTERQTKKQKWQARSMG